MNSTDTRCKAGDLAVVVRADYESNLGRIVQVIAQDVGASFVKFEGRGSVWWVTCPSLMTWSMGGKSFSRRSGPVPDECLMPIRGGSGDIADEEAFKRMLDKLQMETIREGAKQ